MKNLKISICIPQYNRINYLIRVLESIRHQTYKNIEILISDDFSSDSTQSEILNYLSNFDLDLKYFRQDKNIGYDANLRFSMGMASGDYLLILGNDDSLSESKSIQNLVDFISRLKILPAVVICNYHEYSDPGTLIERVNVSNIIGTGPVVALNNFRKFSFVGGLVFNRHQFKKYDTNIFDGSIYVQIYLGAKIVASGGYLAGFMDSLVAKDVVVNGVPPDRFIDKLGSQNKRLSFKCGGLDKVGFVAYEAIAPTWKSSNEELKFKIFRQILVTSYAYWLFSYRKQGVYVAAINLALGCYPGILTSGVSCSRLTKLRLAGIHVVVSFFGLFAPLVALEKLKIFLLKK